MDTFFSHSRHSAVSFSSTHDPLSHRLHSAYHHLLQASVSSLKRPTQRHSDALTASEALPNPRALTSPVVSPSDQRPCPSRLSAPRSSTGPQLQPLPIDRAAWVPSEPRRTLPLPPTPPTPMRNCWRRKARSVPVSVETWCSNVHAA